MEPLTACLRDGKIVLEIDAERFLADATGESANQLTIVDRQQFLAFALQHIFTLTHDVDRNGAHRSWWFRLSETLAKAAASANAGVRRHEALVPACGCDPEEHDGG